MQHHHRQPSLDSLPNELFSHMLQSFDTRELISLGPVCRRFYLEVLRIVKLRLATVASLPDNELILECYHPSAKISTPYLSCRYLGLRDRRGDFLSEDELNMHALCNVYSSFKPVVTEENRRKRTWLSLVTFGASSHAAGPDDTATQDVNFEDGERFSQLCVVTNVVKEGPRPGLFISHVNTSESVVRVFREWLASMANCTPSGAKSDMSLEDGRILWADSSKDVGLRFEVSLGPMERMPVISSPEDEPPISYKLVYKELLMRTTKLLLAVERSLVEETSPAGNAIVIASM